jgi:hypothetical protein
MIMTMALMMQEKNIHTKESQQLFLDFLDTPKMLRTLSREFTVQND